MQGFLTGHLQPGLREKLRLDIFPKPAAVNEIRPALGATTFRFRVTAAACKTIVKQRLCCWNEWQQHGAAVVLSLRTLSHRSGRWEQFLEQARPIWIPVAA